jgi:predicted kinase
MPVWSFRFTHNLIYILNMPKVMPTKPLLIMLYGFPGAGKTFFARQLCEHLQAAHIHSDRIRAELFEHPRYDKEENMVISQLMDYMTEEFLRAGLSVVYDVNAMRLGQRRSLRDLARKAHAEPVLVWLQIDIDSAFARSTKRDRRRVDDKYSAILDRQDYERIVGGMQNPQGEEYVVISGKHTFNTQLSAILKRLRELGLAVTSNSEANVAKPGLVNLVPNPAAGRVDMTRRNIVIR